MNIKSILFFIFTFLSVHSLFAVNTETVITYSQSMQKEIKAVVFTPDSYDSGILFPVVYLLHGHGGSYEDWSAEKNGIGKLADLYNVIIVCPDGNRNSWYFDSPVEKTSKYETYISKELVNWIDNRYNTIKNPKGRGITGLSMGGHGALYLAIRHQDIYGVAGSMSGGVDIRPFPNNWELSQKLGSYNEHAGNWEKNTVINMIDQIKPGLAIIVDCGVDDFFYQVNCRFHEKLLKNKIPHDFIARPGEHNWDYWRNAVKYQLLFMSDYFKK